MAISKIVNALIASEAKVKALDTDKKTPLNLTIQSYIKACEKKEELIIVGQSADEVNNQNLLINQLHEVIETLRNKMGIEVYSTLDLIAKPD
ncbi:MAG: hypothetical protein ACEY3A_05460 [Wolbachia sp.]